MKRGRSLILSVMAVILLSAVPSMAQDFTNLSAKQFGEKVNLEYAISGESLGQLFTVTPYYSLDAASSFFVTSALTPSVLTAVIGKS